MTSSFTGVELVLFGSVERDAATVPRRGGYDIVGTVTGPRETVVVRRKDRVFGIWANAESETFPAAPVYLAVLSNRPRDRDRTAGSAAAPRGRAGADADPERRRLRRTPPG